jgi:hypothetical protein
MQPDSQTQLRLRSSAAETQLPRIQANPNSAERKNKDGSEIQSAYWARPDYFGRQTLAMPQVFPPHQKQIIQIALLAPPSFFPI